MPDVFGIFHNGAVAGEIADFSHVDNGFFRPFLRIGIILFRIMKRFVECLQIGKQEAERLLKTNKRGSQVMLEVDGQSMDVLIKEIDYDPLKNQIQEIDFQALVSGEKVHSVAEIVLLNHEKVTTGVLQQLLEEVSYRALPSALVEKIEVDAGNLKVGDSIKVRDLSIASDQDVELLTDLDAVVATVSAVHNSVPEPEEGEAAGEQ